LQAEVGGKLATAYLAQQQWTSAGGEFERVAATAVDPEVSRAARWQAAELHDKAGDAFTARSYETYLKRHPQPLDPAVQARARLAQLSSGERSLAWWKDVVQADANGGAQRTDRTRALAARGTLALAAPSLEAYRKVALIEPLARQLKLKKARMEEVLKAYAAAADFGAAEVTTAATFHTAALYQDFGQSLIGSQRPKKLSKAELEQYNVMLEEQAFPFEEKAIELHEANAKRASSGIYDEWVRASFGALGQIKPARWGKSEREDPASPLNQQGIALRGQGEFAKAREAYERAMAADPKASAPVLNLAILNDLYLGHPARALALYEQALALSVPADPAVTRWVAELKQRKPETAAVVSRKDTP
jgi:tetratricopeptide (TPR) repeat protein